MKKASDTSGMSLGTQIALASELGGYTLCSVMLGYFGGNWLDGFFKTAPYCVIGGLMLGLGLAMTIVVMRSNQLDNSGLKTKKEPPPGSK